MRWRREEGRREKGRREEGREEEGRGGKGLDRGVLLYTTLNHNI